MAPQPHPTGPRRLFAALLLGTTLCALAVFPLVTAAAAGPDVTVTQVDDGVYYVDVWADLFFVRPTSDPLLSPNVYERKPAVVPSVLTIPVGTKVTWRFIDIDNHSVVFDDGSFTGRIASGLCGNLPFEPLYCTDTRQFTQPGTFTYHDGEHPEVVGTIIVTPQSVVVFR